jgi:hypothetical protein
MKNYKQSISIKLIILTIFVGVLLQCSEVEEVLVYAGEMECYHNRVDSYNLSQGKWETDTINYFIKDFPTVKPVEYEEALDRSFAIYSEYMGKVIRKVYSEDNTDIIILIKKQDGIGGQLGLSWFPPVNEYSPHPVPIEFDYWDVSTVEGRKRFSFFL